MHVTDQIAHQIDSIERNLQIQKRLFQRLHHSIQIKTIWPNAFKDGMAAKLVVRETGNGKYVDAHILRSDGEKVELTEVEYSLFKNIDAICKGDRY